VRIKEQVAGMNKLLLLVVVFGLSQEATAGTARQKALALLSVGRVHLQLAAEKPDLQDGRGSHSGNSAVNQAGPDPVPDLAPELVPEPDSVQDPVPDPVPDPVVTPAASSQVPKIISVDEELQEERDELHRQVARLKEHNDRIVEASVELGKQAEEELSRAGHEIELLRGALIPVSNASGKPESPTDTPVDTAIVPMTLRFDVPASSAGPDVVMPAVQWRESYFHAMQESAATGRTVFVEVGAKWCNPCAWMEMHTFSDPHVIEVLNSQFIPVRVDADDEPKLKRGFRVESLPSQFLVTKDYQVPKRSSGQKDAGGLLEFLGVERVAGIAAAGFGGSIRARSQIENAIAMWIQHIGTTKPDGSPIKVTATLRRTGGQAFPLIHMKPEQWTFKNIFGSLGEFVIDAPGSKLPVQPLLLGYRRAGNNLMLRGEIMFDERRLGLPGDVLNPVSGPVMGGTFGEVQPAGFGPVTLWTIVSVARDIISLLNPTCDLTMGGQVSATAYYDPKKKAIVIEFHDMVSIKLVALWTFDLSIKQIVLDPSNVHVEFTGSKLVKSRDFKVD
jgi:thiol-disulfide isomerase/thioredoxin